MLQATPLSSRTFSSSQTKLCTRQTLIPHSPPPGPGGHHSTYSVSEFDDSRYVIVRVESNEICPFVPGLLSLAKCPRVLEVQLWCSISESSSFSRLHTIDRISFICSSTNGHMGRLHFLATVNDGAVVMSVQVYVCVPAFNSLGCRPRREITGSYGNSVFNFRGAPHYTR